MIVLLHGFWGGPADWNNVVARLPLGEELWIPDLYTDPTLSPRHDFMLWTDHFLAELDRRAGAVRPVRLVGYSMGGRLALHTVLRAPRRFERALLLSARPVWPLAEVGRRKDWERHWSHRFRADPWPELEQAWNGQEIFVDTGTPGRRRDDALREPLGRSLTEWSVLRHRFGPEALADLPDTVEFAYGALDQKCASLAKELPELGVRGQINRIANAGHRLPVDAAAWIGEWLGRA